MTFVSLCATNYNSLPVTLRSLESVLRLSEGLDREVVIVDNLSTDGSYEALAGYHASVPIRLLRRRCSRGLGRQLAFEMSRGDYVAIFDLDTVYNSNWGRLLRWAIANQVSYEVQAQFCQIFPRSVIERVGGWRDFQYREDLDISNRAAVKGLFRAYGVFCGENLKHGYTTNIISKWLRSYANHRDQVALFTWVSLRLYLRAYLVWLRRRHDFLLLAYFSAFAIAYLPGLIKRKLLGVDHKDFSAQMDPSLRIDCGLVPEHELKYDWRYMTASMCYEALSKGDYRFLVGGYE